jgi:PAS domain S-box-containing protein
MTTDRLAWQTLPTQARFYVIAVLAAGITAVVMTAPRTLPAVDLFAALLAASCLTSAWKVNLPIPLASGSTLSMSYAADLAALLLLGTGPAVLIAITGAYTQCTWRVKRPYPVYRTAFSLAAEAITMAATGAAYRAFGGQVPPPDALALAKPLVVAILTYFTVNTGLVATAIALSTRAGVFETWRDDFLWSAISFMVAGSAGGAAALVVARGHEWAGLLLAMPVYLVHRTYRVFVGRLADERRHSEETQRLHAEALDALEHARRSQRALAEEKERLVVMLRSIGDGVIATDLDGTIVLINNVAEALTGWPRDEAIGRGLSTVFQSVDTESRQRNDSPIAAAARIEGPSGARRTSVLVARDFSERPIDECAAPLRDASGAATGMVLVFRDLTDTLRAQEERSKASRLSSLGLLAGGIAHDFNNILMSIMGNISMARATMAGRETAGALVDAEQACIRARQITWQLLTFSKGGVPVKKPVDVAKVLEEAASLALRGSNVSCAFDIPSDLWTIDADEGQLIQVFTNLLINAQQAMPHGGGVTVRAENTFELTSRSQHALRIEPGPYLRVSIVDQGIGIPAEHLPRIFDPYFSTKQQGSGLGLATTHSIVKTHGGFIGVDSQLGRGTTIDVHFPAPTAVERRDARARVVRDGEARHGRPRVLVMDDEASVRTLASNMLKFLGYDAEVVDGGKAALNRFTHARETGRPFDAVMLDLVVPRDLGGRDAIGLLTALDPGVKAILVSGYAQDETISSFREFGFAAAMTKPYTLQELRVTLESVISAPGMRVH